MFWQQALHRFQLQDNCILNEEICRKFAYNYIPKSDGYRHLLLHAKSFFLESYSQSVLIHLFDVSISQLIVNIETDANYSFRYRVVFHDGTISEERNLLNSKHRAGETAKRERHQASPV